MTSTAARPLDRGRKLLLTGAAAAAVAAPIAFGVLNAPPAWAQVQSGSDARLAFEVASIEPSQSSDLIAVVRAFGGRYTATSIRSGL